MSEYWKPVSNPTNLATALMVMAFLSNERPRQQSAGGAQQGNGDFVGDSARNQNGRSAGLFHAPQQGGNPPAETIADGPGDDDEQEQTQIEQKQGDHDELQS